MTCTKLTPAMRKARNTRRAAGTAFYAGAVASLAANVYASQHSLIGVLTGVWSPLATLLALEMLERMPKATLVRKLGVGFLALVAAYTSYWHLVHVFSAADADLVTTYLGPLTVDCLMGFARLAMNTKAASPTRSARRTTKAATKPVRLKSVA